MHLLETTCQVIMDAGSTTIVPKGLLKHKALSEALISEFGLSGETSLSDRDLLAQSLGDAETTQAALKALAAARSADQLTLSNGFWRREDGAEQISVVIEEIRLSHDQCYARVANSTETAIALIERVFSVVEETFGLPSILDKIETRRYGTSTKVKFKFKIESLLSDGLQRLLEQDLKQAAKSTPETKVVIHPFDIICKVHQTSEPGEQSPRNDRWNFEIEHVQYTDHDNRIYRVFSQLPYDKHCELLERLESYQ